MHDSPRLVASSATAYLEITNGLKIRYAAAGHGEPVLLLHGWGGTIDSMGLIFNDLVTHYTVVAVDFPGHGESDLPLTEAWGVSDYAAWVLQVMDALNLRRPHLIAHSHGGRVSIKLAVTHADRVGKLVLVNSAGIPPRRPWTYYARALLANIGKGLARYGGSVGERSRTLMYRAIASTDYANAGPLRDTLVKLVNEDLTPLLPHIAASTLLLWGEDDTETPVACAMLMQRRIPHAELVVLKHAGHFSYIDQFGKFRLVVRKFLRQ